MTALAQRTDAAIMERVVIAGDLAQLTPDERVTYYMKVCESVGLNPLTKPFEYIKLNGKLTLYALKTTTDQLRQIHSVSITRTDKELSEGVYLVTAHARTADGREDSDVGAVNIKGLTGENLANAMMKALTKAKRRVTLSICGLGWLDESEVDSVPNAQAVQVDVNTGRLPAELQDRRRDVTAEVAREAGVTSARVQQEPADRLRANIKQLWAEAKKKGLDAQLEPFAAKFPNWRTNDAEAHELRLQLIFIIENIPEAAEATELITDAQRGQLMGHMTRVGLGGKDDSDKRARFYNWFGGVTVPQVKHTNELTLEEAEALISMLSTVDAHEAATLLAEFEANR